jgi:hypothetical protein
LDPDPESGSINTDPGTRIRTKMSRIPNTDRHSANNIVLIFYVVLFYMARGVMIMMRAISITRPLEGVDPTSPPPHP